VQPEEAEFMDFVNLGLFITVLLVVIRAFLKRYYIVLKNGEVKIIRPFFYPEKLFADQIIEFHVEFSLLTSSCFLLKDGKKVKLDPFSISKNGIKKIQSILNDKSF
jgi:hypothetical protein